MPQQSEAGKPGDPPLRRRLLGFFAGFAGPKSVSKRCRRVLQTTREGLSRIDGTRITERESLCLSLGSSPSDTIGHAFTSYTFNGYEVGPGAIPRITGQK